MFSISPAQCNFNTSPTLNFAVSPFCRLSSRVKFGVPMSFGSRPMFYNYKIKQEASIKSLGPIKSTHNVTFYKILAIGYN